VAAVDIERFAERLVYLAPGARVCVLAGSVPPGAPEDAYAGLITKLRELGVLNVLDTDRGEMGGACGGSAWPRPTASRCARGCAPAPPWSPRTSRRPRRPWATSSTTSTTS